MKINFRRGNTMRRLNKTITRYMLALLLMNILHGMEQENQRELPKVFVIPGISNDGYDEDYVTRTTGISPEKIHRVGTPAIPLSDLGQSSCTKHLKDALQNNEDDFILYANSQGTATALNFLSQNPKHKDNCKGIVLEAVLGSGNSAIYHSTTVRFVPALKKIPGLYYLAPYLAKIFFLTYWPAGDQPIKSVKNLKINGPIIIGHSKKDPELSYKDACAIYYALRQKNDDIYFISKNGNKHVELFRNRNNASTVRNILASHGLSPAGVNSIDLRDYQPDPADHKAAYDELMAKERTHIWIKRGLWPISFIMAYKIVTWLSGKILR